MISLRFQIDVFLDIPLNGEKNDPFCIVLYNKERLLTTRKLSNAAKTTS